MAAILKKGVKVGFSNGYSILLESRICATLVLVSAFDQLRHYLIALLLSHLLAEFTF